MACQNLWMRFLNNSLYELTCLLCLGDGLCLGKREPPDGPYSFIKYSEVSLFVSVYLISWTVIVVYIRNHAELGFLAKKILPQNYSVMAFWQHWWGRIKPKSVFGVAKRFYICRVFCRLTDWLIDIFRQA